MRIASNSVSEGVLAQIQQLTAQQSKLQNQVATGQRIFQPEDDPAAVGRVLSLQSDQRQVAQYAQNATRALDLAQASYSGLQSIKQVSDRASEIGTLGAGVLSPESATAYASEVNQLIENTLQVANTSFRGEHLFAGTAVSAAPFTAARDVNGDVTSVSYGGNSNQASIQVTETSSIAASTSGATNTGLGAFINHLVALRDALSANDTSAVNAAQTNLVSDGDSIVSSLAENGGVQTRIQAIQDQQTNIADSLQASVSAQTSVDLSTAIVKLTQTQNAYQAALQSGAQIMKTSLLDYLPAQ
jgi:flagellar hook-associated protein 3 FlgL